LMSLRGRGLKWWQVAAAMVPARTVSACQQKHAELNRQGRVPSATQTVTSHKQKKRPAGSSFTSADDQAAAIEFVDLDRRFHALIGPSDRRGRRCHHSCRGSSAHATKSWKTCTAAQRHNVSEGAHPNCTTECKMNGFMHTLRYLSSHPTQAEMKHAAAMKGITQGSSAASSARSSDASSDSDTLSPSVVRSIFRRPLPLDSRGFSLAYSDLSPCLDSPTPTTPHEHTGRPRRPRQSTTATRMKATSTATRTSDSGSRQRSKSTAAAPSDHDDADDIVHEESDDAAATPAVGTGTPWTEQEHARLKQLRGRGLTWREVSERMVPTRSDKACSYQFWLLNKRRTKRIQSKTAVTSAATGTSSATAPPKVTDAEDILNRAPAAVDDAHPQHSAQRRDGAEIISDVRPPPRHDNAIEEQRMVDTPPRRVDSSGADPGAAPPRVSSTLSASAADRDPSMPSLSSAALLSEYEHLKSATQSSCEEGQMKIVSQYSQAMYHTLAKNWRAEDPSVTCARKMAKQMAALEAELEETKKAEKKATMELTECQAKLTVQSTALTKLTDDHHAALTHETERATQLERNTTDLQTQLTEAKSKVIVQREKYQSDLQAAMKQQDKKRIAQATKLQAENEKLSQRVIQLQSENSAYELERHRRAEMAMNFAREMQLADSSTKSPHVMIGAAVAGAVSRPSHPVQTNHSAESSIESTSKRKSTDQLQVAEETKRQKQQHPPSLTPPAAACNSQSHHQSQQEAAEDEMEE
jgi:hypothetical protein